MLLDALREAMAAGEIETREEALELARQADDQMECGIRRVS
jgi:hypothetical protein